MRTVLVIVGLLVSLAASPQEIYRWVDKDGIVHYADQPGAPDAQRVEYPGLGLTNGDGVTPELYTPDAQPEQPEAAAYRSLSIASPSADQVFFGTDVTVDVVVEVSPELRPDHQLLIFYDDNRVPTNDNLSATLRGVTRGSHVLRAAVIDGNGVVVITSPQTTFHLRQATVGTPNTGPALRPPPPKRPGSNAG